MTKEERLKQIEALLAAGHSIAHTAELVGLSRSYTGKVALANGWGKRGARRKKGRNRKRREPRPGRGRGIIYKRCPEHGKVEWPCRICRTLEWMRAKGRKP
jgi:hypothetical protein